MLAVCFSDALLTSPAFRQYFSNWKKRLKYINFETDNQGKRERGFDSGVRAAQEKGWLQLGQFTPGPRNRLQWVLTPTPKCRKVPVSPNLKKVSRIGHQRSRGASLRNIFSQPLMSKRRGKTNYKSKCYSQSCVLLYLRRQLHNSAPGQVAHGYFSSSMLRNSSYVVCWQGRKNHTVEEGCAQACSNLRS